MRPARRPLLVAACLVSLAAGATRLAAQSSADVSVQCDRAGNPAFPDARARVQAAAGQGGAAGAFAQGCLALGEGRYEPAASAFEQAVRADDRAAAYHYFLGRAYGAQAQRASMMSRASLARKTKAEFERAVQLDPEFLDAREGLMQYYLQAPGFMGGSPQKAREQAHEVRKRAPYRGALLYATLAARDKDLAGAVRELDGMTRQFPDSTAPYVQLAVLQSQQKNWPAVWAAVDRLGRARPDAVLDFCPAMGMEVALDEEMACVEAEDIVTGERLLVPAELVFLPAPPHFGARYFGSNSNGLASGNTVLEATVHALAEVVERDVCSFHSLDDRSALVEPASLPPPVSDIARSLAPKGLELHVRHLKNAFGLPLFSAAVAEPEGLDPVYVSAGFGCHPSRQIAVVRAVCEAFQSRLSFIHGGRDDLTERSEHFEGWTAKRRARYASRLLAKFKGGRRRVRFEETDDQPLQHYGDDQRHDHYEHGANEPRDELGHRRPEVFQYLLQRCLLKCLVLRGLPL